MLQLGQLSDFYVFKLKWNFILCSKINDYYELIENEEVVISKLNYEK